jgi:transketolase
MRKQLVKTVGDILDLNTKTTLLLGDIGVFGFRKSFESHPGRVFNIGILEQSTISLASGMSSIGLIPIVHTIAPFLVERSLESISESLTKQKLLTNYLYIFAARIGCNEVYIDSTSKYVQDRLEDFAKISSIGI